VVASSERELKREAAQNYSKGRAQHGEAPL